MIKITGQVWNCHVQYEGRGGHGCDSTSDRKAGQVPAINSFIPTIKTTNTHRAKINSTQENGWRNQRLFTI